MPQSTWDAVVARVKAQVETVADVGNVHDRLRLAVDERQFEAAIYATIGAERKLRAWYIDLREMPTQPSAADGTMQWSRNVTIEGFLSFEDASGSDKTAVALAESIIRTLWSDLRATKLGGTVLTGKPGRIADKNPRNFAGVVCSYVRVEMPLESIETP